VFILFAASKNLEYHCSRPETRKCDEIQHISGIRGDSTMQHDVFFSYISGDGFPFSTSSPPTIAAKDSFQPVEGKNKPTNK
jgi:hypothetical protein